MFLLKPIQHLVNALVQEDSPGQMAAGFALGAAAGLIPKTSLFAHLIFLAICVVNVNMVTAAAGTALFTFIARFLDPLTHWIGYILLVDFSFLKPLWTFLYNFPVVPWTEFNHTVTLGSFVLGGILFYPIFKLTTPVFAKYTEKWGDKIKKLKIVQLLRGVEVAQQYRLPGNR